MCLISLMELFLIVFIFFWQILLIGHPTEVEEIDHLILASLWSGVALAKQVKHICIFCLFYLTFNFVHQFSNFRTER